MTETEGAPGLAFETWESAAPQAPIHRRRGHLTPPAPQHPPLNDESAASQNRISFGYSLVP